jgi:hypothetical protein
MFVKHNNNTTVETLLSIFKKGLPFPAIFNREIRSPSTA